MSQCASTDIFHIFRLCQCAFTYIFLIFEQCRCASTDIFHTCAQYQCVSTYIFLIFGQCQSASTDIFHTCGQYQCASTYIFLIFGHYQSHSQLRRSHEDATRHALLAFITEHSFSKKAVLRTDSCLQKSVKLKPHFPFWKFQFLAVTKRLE
jgi:hypothetical protein